MNDQDFKLQVVSDIAEIKTNLTYIKNALPSESLEGKVNLNRKLILWIFPMLFSFFIGMLAIIVSKHETETRDKYQRSSKSTSFDVSHSGFLTNVLFRE